MKLILTLVLLAPLAGCATSAGPNPLTTAVAPVACDEDLGVYDEQACGVYFYDLGVAQAPYDWEKYHHFPGYDAAPGGYLIEQFHAGYASGKSALIRTWSMSSSRSYGTSSLSSYGSTTPGATNPANPVYQNMINQPGGWIHENDPNPVRYQMERQPGGWIHSTNPNPVKSQMCAQSWIHC